MAATAGRGNGGRFSGGMVAGCLALLLALAGCSRDPGGQLPEAGGEKLQAKREQVSGFGLVLACCQEYKQCKRKKKLFHL